MSGGLKWSIQSYWLLSSGHAQRLEPVFTDAFALSCSCLSFPEEGSFLIVSLKRKLSFIVYSYLFYRLRFTCSRSGLRQRAELVPHWLFSQVRHLPARINAVQELNKSST